MAQIVTLLFVMVVQITLARKPPSFRIGSVFDDLSVDRSLHQTFRQTVENLNRNPDTLNGTRIDSDTQFASHDVYDAYQKVCREMQYRVISVFGSAPSTIDDAVASVCSALQIPYLTTATLQVNDEAASHANVGGGGAIGDDHSLVFRLGPSQRHLGEAVTAFVSAMGWTDVALISHRPSGNLDIQMVLEKLQGFAGKVHLLDLTHSDIRADVGDLRNKGVKHFIVDIGSRYIFNFFEQAMKSGIVHTGTSFVLPCLNFAALDLDSIRLTGAEVYGFSLTKLNSVDRRMNRGDFPPDLAYLIKDDYRAALLFDGVNLFGKAMDTFLAENDLSTPQVKCSDKEEPFPLGKTIFRQIEETEFEGVTGRIKFLKGQRNVLEIGVVRLLQSGGFIKVGVWHQDENASSLQISREAIKRSDEQSMSYQRPFLTADTLIVADSPYMMLKRKKAPNLQFKGFLKDMMDKVSKDLDVEIQFRPSEEIGSVSSDSGNWTGIIGNLVKRESDIGVAPILVTSARSKVVDFTPPFETSKLVIVVKNREINGGRGLGIHLSDLLAPFSAEMWVCVAVSFVVMSMATCLVARLSPYQRLATATAAPNDPAGSAGVAGGGLGLGGVADSFWFAFSGLFLMPTHPPVVPKSASTRFLAAVWWFFCVVTLCLYVISLSGLMHWTTRAKPVSLDDFMSGPDGDARIILVDGQTSLEHIQDSKDPVHTRLLDAVDPNHNFTSISEALTAIAGDDDANGAGDANSLGVLLDSRTAQLHLLQQPSSASNCRHNAGGLTVVDTGLTLHHALALPKGSPLKDSLSSLVLTYKETGVMTHLAGKWFKSSHHQECNGRLQQYPGTVHVTNFNGQFILLILAVVGSLALAFLELLCYSNAASKKSSRHGHGHLHHHHRSFCQTVREEVKMAIAGGGGGGCSHLPNTVVGRHNNHSPAVSASSSPLMRASVTSPNLTTTGSGHPSPAPVMHQHPQRTPFKLQQPQSQQQQQYTPVTVRGPYEPSSSGGVRGCYPSTTAEDAAPSPYANRKLIRAPLPDVRKTASSSKMI